MNLYTLKSKKEVPVDTGTARKRNVDMPDNQRELKPPVLVFAQNDF